MRWIGNLYFFSLRALFILSTFFLFNNVHAQELFSGFSEISGKYRNDELNLKVWYPTKESSSKVSLGYFDMAATRNAEINDGQYGLVIISHGDRGSDLNHRNLALHLSKHGYIVAAFMHPHNNYQQNDQSRKAINWIERPEHISKSLDIIQQSRFHAFVDTSRVSIIGHSAGAYTAISIVGGAANISNIEIHCSENGENDPEFCGNSFVSYLREFFQEPTTADLIRRKDNRIKSAVALAPMGVQFYGSETLNEVDVPVLLLGAEHDDVLPRKFHAEYLASNIKGAKYEVISGAGHYSFITPFPSKLRGQVGDADKDPSKFNRATFMGQLENRILSFLESTKSNNAEF